MFSDPTGDPVLDALQAKQDAAANAKRQADVRKCEQMCNALADDIDMERIANIRGETAANRLASSIRAAFPEIKDWNWTLETAHEKEILDEWTVKKLQMDTAKEAVDSGFDVEIDEDGTPKISGTGKQAAPAPNPFAPKPEGGNLNEPKVGNA